MIYHVTTQAEWNACASMEHYCPSAFLAEHFIHACSPAQLPGVLQRYFQGQNNLLLLHIDEHKLSVPVEYEPSTGNELYPHIYGVINKTAIINRELINE